MKTKNILKKSLITLVLTIKSQHAHADNASPVLVDSFLGGNLYSTAPFGGLTAVTPSWQNLGQTFVPDLSSQLTQLDVSIFAEAGTQGAARLTVFQYNQPVGNATYVNIGPALGSAEVPVASSGGLGGLVAFDFSAQNIQLEAGQTYAFMLSDPQFTSLSPAWRRVDYTIPGGLEINSEDQFTGGGFDYASVVVGARMQYEVFASPVPEPGSLGFATVMLSGAALWKVRRCRRN